MLRCTKTVRFEGAAAADGRVIRDIAGLRAGAAGCLQFAEGPEAMAPALIAILLLPTVLYVFATRRPATARARRRADGDPAARG